MEENLRYSHPSGGAHTRWVGPRSLALAALCLLAVPCLSQAAPLPRAAYPGVRGDTTRTPSRFHFRKSVSLDTEYLSRVISGSSVKPDVPIEVSSPNQEDGRATSYAKRFGITRELAQKILETATAEGLDPELGFRLVRVESAFVTRARGPQGSLGLVQLMPGTARMINRALRTEAQILDPDNNLRAGFKYLRQMIDRYGGNVRLGLLAYNRGEVAVDRALKSGRDPENGYSHKVLGTRGSNPYQGVGLLLGNRKGK